MLPTQPIGLIIILLPFAMTQPPTRPPELGGNLGGVGGPKNQGRRPMNDGRPPPPQYRGPPRSERPHPPYHYNGPPLSERLPPPYSGPIQSNMNPEPYMYNGAYHPGMPHLRKDYNQVGQAFPDVDPGPGGDERSDWVPVRQMGPAIPEWTPRFADHGPRQVNIAPYPAGAGPPQQRMGGAQRPEGPPPRMGRPQGPGGPPQNARLPPQMMNRSPPNKHASVPWADLGDRPVIGVLTQASKIHVKDYGNDYVKKEYIKWLEMAGAYVTLVQAGQSKNQYREIFSRINGLFLPGGGAPLRNSTFSEAIRTFVDLAIEANDKGDHFPIWGTCLGFEIMVIQAAKMYALNETDSTNMSLPLVLSPSYKTTQMLGSAPQEIIDYLTRENSTANFHIMSLLTETYNQVEPLNKFFRVVSTNKGRDGQDFVSTMEAYNYPIFAVQWHPEKPIFLRRPDLAIPTSLHAIKIGQYFANFFISEARKSKHRFRSDEERMLAVVADDDSYCLPKSALTNMCKMCSCCRKEPQHSWSTDLCLGAVTCLCIALFSLYVWPTLYIFPSVKQLFYYDKCK